MSIWWIRTERGQTNEVNLLRCVWIYSVEVVAVQMPRFRFWLAEPEGRFKLSLKNCKPIGRKKILIKLQPLSPSTESHSNLLTVRRLLLMYVAVAVPDDDADASISEEKLLFVVHREWKCKMELTIHKNPSTSEEMSRKKEAKRLEYLADSYSFRIYVPNVHSSGLWCGKHVFKWI